jgi:hypothetical protein
VRLLVWKSSSQVWAQLHEKAFRRLAGAARVVVLDNLKEGVLLGGGPQRYTSRRCPTLKTSTARASSSIA